MNLIKAHFLSAATPHGVVTARGGLHLFNFGVFRQPDSFPFTLRLAPEYQKAAKNMNNLVNFVAVDCDDANNRAVCVRFKSQIDHIQLSLSLSLSDSTTRCRRGTMSRASLLSRLVSSADKRPPSAKTPYVD